MSPSSPVQGSTDPVKFICSFPNCGKYFVKVKYLRRHQKVHDQKLERLKPSFLCPYDDCIKLFWTQHDLNKHVKTPHETKTHKLLTCKHCEKEFKHKFDLKIHEAVHTGDKPLVCETCGAAFALKARLKIHMKTHKTYPCNLENCTFTCEKWTLLRKHVSDFHKKKCPSCCKRFTNKESLEKHISTHSLVLKCPHCELTYSNKSNLRTHFRTVHEKVTYKCTYYGCNKELQHRKSLRNHLNAHKKSGQVIPKEPKKLITKRNTLLVTAVSGVAPDDDLKEELLNEDKEFRSQFKLYQNEVRIY